MDNSSNQIFYTSSDYLKDFKKKTWIFIFFFVSTFFIDYYCVWILATSPVKQLKTNDNTINILSIFNPFKTQEDYIFFLVFGIFPVIFIGVSIFWARAKKMKRLAVIAVQITTEDFMQKFDNETTQKVLWSQVKKIALYRKDVKEILYIKIYGKNNEKFIVYSMYPWNELINYIQKICESKNIEQVTYNARFGSKKYLLGSPDFSIMLTMPILVIANQLKATGLQLFAYIIVASYTILIFAFTAYFTQPLDNDRSKYKYWSFSLMILCLTILVIAQRE